MRGRIFDAPSRVLLQGFFSAGTKVPILPCHPTPRSIVSPSEYLMAMQVSSLCPSTDLVNALNRRAFQWSSDEDGAFHARMKVARGMLASRRYDEALPQITRIFEDAKLRLAAVKSCHSRELSQYHAAKNMLKAASYPSALFRDGAGKRSVQVLIFDSSGERVLTQRRGSFKRLFAGKYTVSASAKLTEGLDIAEAAASAILKEVGLRVDKNSLLQIGGYDEYQSHLVSYDFYAFDDDEEKALSIVADGISLPKGITIEYSPLKRALSLYSADPEVEAKEVAGIASKISDETGIESIFPVFDRDSNSLMVLRLDDSQQAEVNKIAESRWNRRRVVPLSIGGGFGVEGADLINEDELHFVNWMKLRDLFRSDPHMFALDLTAPYFGSDKIWENIGQKPPQFMHIDDEAAGLHSLAGGKGANTHFLRGLTGLSTPLGVPDTFVISISAFEKIVLSNKSIMKDVELLDSADNEDVPAIARRIRSKIRGIKLPEDLVGQIRDAFFALGGEVAVRSSANSEDMKDHSAAGMAKSFLHQITSEGAVESVVKVWQSLYSDGFVDYRKSISFPQKDARMAVLIQKFIDPKVSGVVFSFDQATFRPAYRISAQPGVGEGVVNSVGLADGWVVSNGGDEILESIVNPKRFHIVKRKGGGIKKEEMSSDSPSLNDEEVLRLARISKMIHGFYRGAGKSNHVDIEYVLDGEGSFRVVQVRPKILSPSDSIIRYNAIDMDMMQPGTVPVHLYERSQVAYPGAVVGRLQVLRGKPHETKPGVILLTDHTNNEFNSIFGSLLGVITTDGDVTSHAGQHAFEKRIPCLVGALYAFEALEKYDGSIISFDSSGRIVIEGAQPIREYEIASSMWLEDEDSVKAAVKGKDPHEIERKWEDSKARRARVFFEDYEGRWRRRSNAYTNFQLDYYYLAWDRLTEILRGMFSGREPFILESQERALKADRTGRYLFQRVVENDPKSIYNYITKASGFCVEDCERLFDARLNGFKKFAEFMNGIERIDADNVEGFVDNLVEIFAWMHFGFWLDAVVDGYASRHLKYISNEGSFHNFLRSEAAAEGVGEIIDPYRGDLQAGKILLLSRNKDKEIYSVLERIRSDSALAGIFQSDDSGKIKHELSVMGPEIMSTIDGWSMRYKHVREHLQDESDTEEYIDDIKLRLRSAGFAPLGELANFYRVFMREKGVSNPSVDDIRRLDGEFYLILKGCARVLAAEKRNSGFRLLPPDLQSSELIAVQDGEITEMIHDALELIRNAHEGEADLRIQARNILNEYKDLGRSMAVYYRQLMLREDGHHLIVPHQRKIARMMRELSLKHIPGIFSNPEEIFGLSTEELVALAKEEDPSYLRQTLSRSALLDAAEAAMSRQWSVEEGDFDGVVAETSGLWNELLNRGYINFYGAIQESVLSMLTPDEFVLADAFENERNRIFDIFQSQISGISASIGAYHKAVLDAVDILRNQGEAATIPRLKEYYLRQEKLLLERVDRLKMIGEK